jgi:hypothetical protein
VNAPGYARIRRHIETRILRRRRPPVRTNRPILHHRLIVRQNLVRARCPGNHTNAFASTNVTADGGPVCKIYENIISQPPST